MNKPFLASYSIDWWSCRERQLSSLVSTQPFYYELNCVTTELARPIHACLYKWWTFKVWQLVSSICSTLLETHHCSVYPSPLSMACKSPYCFPHPCPWHVSLLIVSIYLLSISTMFWCFNISILLSDAFHSWI